LIYGVFIYDMLIAGFASPGCSGLPIPMPNPGRPLKGRPGCMIVSIIAAGTVSDAGSRLFGHLW